MDKNNYFKTGQPDALPLVSFLFVLLLSAEGSTSELDKHPLIRPTSNPLKYYLMGARIVDQYLDHHS